MVEAAKQRTPIAAHLLPSSVFYGWYIAIACAVLMLVGVGVGYYGLPVFLGALQDKHGWSSTQVSVAPAIYFTVSGLTSVVVGPMIDRRGPLGFMAVGMVLNGVSATFIGLVGELWMIYVVYFVFAVAFGMSAGVAVNAIVTRWFVRRRALAMSVSSTGVSLGGVILAPIASKLIDIGGLELATPVLGALVLIVGLPVVLGVIVFDPSDMGLPPDGDDSPLKPQFAATAAAQFREWTRSEAMRTIGFWAIFIAFLLVLVAQTGYIIHQVTFLEERLGSRSEAAFTLSVTAGGSILARLVVGIFADGVDKRLLTFVLFVVQATAILLIVYVEDVLATWLLTLVFGFTIGNVYMMQSLLVGEIFGMVSFGSVFGLISMAGQVGSGLGPIGVGFLHDQTGGYTVPFTVTAIVTYAAAVVILFARPSGEPEPAEPSESETEARTMAAASADAGG